MRTATSTTKNTYFVTYAVNTLPEPTKGVYYVGYDVETGRDMLARMVTLIDGYSDWDSVKNILTISEGQEVEPLWAVTKEDALSKKYGRKDAVHTWT